MSTKTARTVLKVIVLRESRVNRRIRTNSLSDSVSYFRNFIKTVNSHAVGENYS